MEFVLGGVINIDFVLNIFKNSSFELVVIFSKSYKNFMTNQIVLSCSL